jgi:ABC-type cobalamin transport system permease subunit
MNPIRLMTTGALAGLITAILIDLNSWARNGGRFDWTLALPRYLAGAIAGAAAGLAVNAS